MSRFAFHSSKRAVGIAFAVLASMGGSTALADGLVQLQRQITRIQKDTDAANKEAAEANNKIAKSNKKIDEANKKISEYNKELNEANAELACAHVMNDALKKHMINSKDVVHILHGQRPDIYGFCKLQQQFNLE